MHAIPVPQRVAVVVVAAVLALIAGWIVASAFASSSSQAAHSARPNSWCPPQC